MSPTPPPFLEPDEGSLHPQPPPETALHSASPVTEEQPGGAAADVIGWATVVSGVAICLGALVGPLFVRFGRIAMDLAEQSPGLGGAYATPLRWSAFYERHVWWFVAGQLLLGVAVTLLGRAFLKRRPWALPVLGAAATLAWLGGLGYARVGGRVQPELGDPILERLMAFGVTMNMVLVTCLFAGLMFVLTRPPVRAAFRRSQRE